MKMNNTHAVSPVVGVMLMLVVTIIIAAVVSAFAGGAVGGQQKIPQASITGKYSVSNGLQIIHASGDGLATRDTVFTIRDGSMFGPNLEQKTAQILNQSNITNGNGWALGSSGNVTSFAPGDVLLINATMARCENLQPAVYAADPTSSYCISNTTNIGKTFSLEVSDTSGHLISKSDVIITA